MSNLGFEIETVNYPIHMVDKSSTFIRHSHTHTSMPVNSTFTQKHAPDKDTE
jgi:hypothetical protein